MSSASYVISYRTLSPVERSARRTMVDHLDREEAAWKPFLDFFASEYGDMQIPARRQAMTGRQMATAFQQLRAALDDPNAFAAITVDSYRRTAVVPPPSGSTEGQLMLGLHATGRTEDAAAVFARFVSTELAADQYAQRSTGDMASVLQRGETLLAAGHAAAALPASKLASSGIRTSKVRAEQLLASLDEQVAGAAEINAEHAGGLLDLRSSIAQGIVRVRRTLLRAERGRSRRDREWRAEIEAEVQ